MSRVTEAAQREAAQAEREAEPDEPTAPDDAPQTGDEPDAGDDEQTPDEPEQTPTGEQQGEAFARELQRHEAEWSRIAGVAPGSLTACASCGGVGFIELPLRSRPDVKRCEACNGYGETMTGSLREGRAIMDCAVCSGYGYVPDAGESAATRPQESNGITAAPPLVSAEPPEVAALRAAGYTVVPPIHVTTP